MHWRKRATFINYYTSQYHITTESSQNIFKCYSKHIIYKDEIDNLFSTYIIVIRWGLTWCGISCVQDEKTSSQSSKNGSLPSLFGCRRMVCTHRERPLDPALSAPSNLPWQSKYKVCRVMFCNKKVSLFANVLTGWIVGEVPVNYLGCY